MSDQPHVSDSVSTRLTPEKESVIHQSASTVLVTAIWFGLVIGLLELGLMLAVKPIRDPSPGFFRLNRHLVWMIPAVNLAVFSGAGVLLAIASSFRPRVRSRLSIFVLSFLGFLTLLVTYPRLFLLANLALACGFAYRFTRRIERHQHLFQAVVWKSLPLLAVFSTALAGWSFYREVWKPRQLFRLESAERPRRPNVLLVVLDTVRADRLSLYGYERPTTPNLERLAKRGIRFEQARSTSPWTLPSHSSLMTGRWPHQLNCDINEPLDDTYPTLAEYLGRHGYSTGGFVANVNYAGAETGLGRGFSRYEDHEVSVPGALRSTALGKQVIWPILHLNTSLIHRDAMISRKDAAQVNRQVLSWLDQRPTDRPFFAFLNYFDAHDPYIPPEDFQRRFGARSKSSSDFRLFYDWFIRDKGTISARERQLVNDAYDDCLASLDQRLGEMFDALQDRKILDDTLVIITADHGEHFGAHGLYGHASSLYAQETRVPLLILPPRSMNLAVGYGIDESVSLRDIAATIVDAVGADPESTRPFPGQSLTSYWSRSLDPARAVTPRSVLSTIDEPVTAAPNQGRSPVFRGSMQSIVVDGHVYIKNGDGVEELYNTKTDPQELNNLAQSPETEALLVRCRERLMAVLTQEPRLVDDRE